MNENRFRQWRDRLNRIDKQIANKSLPKYLVYPLPLIENPLPRKSRTIGIKPHDKPYLELQGLRYKTTYSASSEFGLPCGPMSRILVAYSTTLMRMNNTRKVVLARNNKMLIKLLGYTDWTGGGKRGLHTRISRELDSLIRTSIQIEKVKRGKNQQIEIWNGPYDHIESREFLAGKDTVLVHSEAYFQFCEKGGVIPIDTKTLLAFSDTTYGIDFYLYLAKIVPNSKKKQIDLNWKKIIELIDRTSLRPNSTYLEKYFKNCLVRLDYVWPKLNYKTNESGISIFANESQIRRLSAVDNSVSN